MLRVRTLLPPPPQTPLPPSVGGELGSLLLLAAEVRQQERDRGRVHRLHDEGVEGGRDLEFLAGGGNAGR